MPTEDEMRSLDCRLSLDRRALLRSVMALAGVTLVPTGLFAAPAADSKAFFSKAQFELLAEVAEQIIPRTDTPGARDARVPEALDALMRDWASVERRQELVALLAEIDSAVRAQTGQPLLSLPPDQRTAALVAFDKASAFARPAYGRFKALVTRLYYLSEAGATQELRYELVPGRWQPAVPVTPETRAWAIDGMLQNV